jgi:O-antigen ligase
MATTPSVASYSIRSVARVQGGNASIAMGALMAFIVVVFLCPGTLIPELAPYVPAKAFAGLALLGLTISILLYRRKIASGGWVSAGMFLFLGIALLSRLWSTWPEHSSEVTADLIKYVAIYFVMLNVLDSPSRLRMMMLTIVGAALIPTVGAIKGYILGEYLVEGNRAAWISIFGNPDDLAYYLTAATPMALALREMTQSKFQRALLLLTVGLYGAAIFLGASRGGILTLAAVVLIWWVRELRRGRIGAWVLIAITAALLFVPTHVWSRTKTLTDYREDTSAMGRIWTTQAGWKMFLTAPWGGLGAGTFAMNYPSYAPPDAETDIAAMAPHNSFIQVLAEDGLFALAAYLLAIGAGFYLSRRHGEGDDPLAAGAAGIQGAILAFVLSSLTGGIAETWPIYWALGMAAALPRIREALHAPAA